MRNIFRSTIAGLLLFACTTPLAAQPLNIPESLLTQDFENGELGGWATMGDKAKLTVVADKLLSKNGAASLRFNYDIAPGDMNAMLLAADGPVPEMAFVRSLGFWIKTDYAAPIILMLQEQGGGRFMYIFSTPKDVWQRVEVTPEDFFLSEDADDPKDENNKLDMERIEAVAIADMSQIFAANEEIAALLGVRPGPHALYIDDLSASTQPLTLPKAGVATLDTFAYPQPSWLGTAMVNLSVVADEGMKGRALKATYRHSPDKFAAMVRRFGRGVLKGTEWLSLGIASYKPITLIVQVEERGGGKYNVTVNVPGDLRPFEVKLPWKEFTPSDDSKDDNNRLDLDQVNQLVILDATGFLQVADGPNTFWLSQLGYGPVPAVK